MQNKQISPEEQAVREADFKSRHVQFDKELKEIIKKYEVTLEAEPFIFRGLLVARPTVSDNKKYIEDSTPTENNEGQAVDGDGKN